MEFQIIETKAFRMQLVRFEKAEQDRVKKKIRALSFNPDQGKPLRAVIREFRCKHLRVYFNIDYSASVVYIMGVSTKKNQDNEIDKIISDLKDFRESIDKTYKGDE